MKLLVRKHGLLMVVVIHQPKPSVAAMFDDLLLLTTEPGPSADPNRASTHRAHT